MGHRPRPSASSDAYTRPSFWFLLLCAIPIVISQADNPTSNVSEVPSQDPPSSTASPPIVPCGGSRPFLCYAYQGLDQAFPEWLQQTEQKCQRCNSLEDCGSRSQIGGHEKGNRLTVYSICVPPFCKAERDTSEEKDCIKAVNFDGNQPGKVFFPFNLCTREMVAFDDCNDQTLSKIRFVPTTGSLTTDYMVQCDAGFMIPSLVVAAGKDKGSSTTRPAMTCVPSLQQAAGYLKDDPSPLHEYTYDVADLKDFIYCEKGGRPNKTSSCEPLPLCIDGNKTLPTSPFTSDEVNLASECELPCKYQYGRMEYNDCVFLDIVNATARKFYSARRALSGPYAELMDEEENVKVHIVPSTSQPPAETRHSRQMDSEEKIRYPRCINSIKLSPDDRKRVEKDLMLNCATNIFVQTLGDEGLIIQPPLCDADDDIRICWNRTVPGMGNGTLPTSEAESLPYWPYGGGLFLIMSLVLGIAIAYFLNKRRTDVPRLGALPFPEQQSADGIQLKDDSTDGNWVPKFDKVMSGIPANLKRGVLRLAETGHIALQINPKTQEENSVTKQAAPSTMPSNKAAAGSKPTVTAEPVVNENGDASEVANKLLHHLADGKKETTEFVANELFSLFDKAKEIVSKHRGVVRITGPVWFIGDLANDFDTAQRLFKAYSELAAPGTKMLSLGNVCKGKSDSLATLVLVTAAMVLHPESIFYLIGDSERVWIGDTSEDTNEHVTGEPEQISLMNRAIELFFDSLPVFAIVDQRILAMSGGICPELKPKDILDGFDPSDPLKSHMRSGTTCSDPSWRTDRFLKKHNRDFIGYLFGPAHVDALRRQLGIDFIIRAHQRSPIGATSFGGWLMSLFLGSGGEEDQRLDAAKTCIESKLGAVLQYDGASSFTMLYFIHNGVYYKGLSSFKTAFVSFLDKKKIFILSYPKFAHDAPW